MRFERPSLVRAYGGWRPPTSYNVIYNAQGALLSGLVWNGPYLDVLGKYVRRHHYESVSARRHRKRSLEVNCQYDQGSSVFTCNMGALGVFFGFRSASHNSHFRVKHCTSIFIWNQWNALESRDFVAFTPICPLLTLRLSWSYRSAPENALSLKRIVPARLHCSLSAFRPSQRRTSNTTKADSARSAGRPRSVMPRGLHESPLDVAVPYCEGNSCQHTSLPLGDGTYYMTHTLTVQSCQLQRTCSLLEQDIVDIKASQCLWRLPGRYSTSKSKSTIILSHLAIFPLGSFKLNNHTNAWWSERTRKRRPNKYCRKYCTKNMTVKTLKKTSNAPVFKFKLWRN